MRSKQIIGWAQKLSLATLTTAILAAPAFPQDFLFTDMSGRDVVLDGPAQSIVTTINPQVGNIIAIDGGIDTLAGINPSAKQMLVDSFLAGIYPGIADVFDGIISGAGGFAPNVETIVGLDPDVVIQWGDRDEDLLAPLENAGLTVAHYLSGSEELAQANNTMIGAMLGEEARAEALNAWRNATLEHIAQFTAGLSDEQRPHAIVVTLQDDGYQVSGGTNSTAYRTIDLAGGFNPAGDLSAMSVVNGEQIAAWDPDVILIFGRSGTPEDLASDPIVALTTAVTEGRVYQLPRGSTSWGSTGVDDPMYWMWLTMILHPEAVDFDLRGEMAEWYRFMYGVEVEEATLDEILGFAANATSANYDMFR